MDRNVAIGPDPVCSPYGSRPATRLGIAYASRRLGIIERIEHALEDGGESAGTSRVDGAALNVSGGRQEPGSEFTETIMTLRQALQAHPGNPPDRRNPANDARVELQSALRARRGR